MENGTQTLAPLVAFTILVAGAGTLNEALGISTERSNTIHEFLTASVKKAGGNDGKITDTLSDIQNNADFNANEKVFATFAYGHGMGVNEDDDATSHEGFGDDTNPLAEMLESLQGGAEGDGSFGDDDDAAGI